MKQLLSLLILLFCATTYAHTALKNGLLPESEHRLEFWAWDFIADRDTTLDIRYHRMEAYLLTVDLPKQPEKALPYRVFKVEVEDLENGDRGEGLYYMDKENYIE